MITWTEITHFGDLTITAFAALAIAAWLLAEGERRLAFWWSMLFSVGTAIVVATKIAFIGWGIGIRAIDFAGFSGHAMRATAVLPVLFYLMLERAPRSLRAIGALAGLAGGVLVGVSRVVVNAHSVSEVVLGVLLGASVSIGFLWVASNTLRRHVITPLRLSLCVLAALHAPYVHPAPTQKWLTRVTMLISGHEQPVSRGAWRDGRNAEAGAAKRMH